VVRNRVLDLHTTRSWDFMRLKPSPSSGILPESRFGEDSIIGVLDTGWCNSIQSIIGIRTDIAVLRLKHPVGLHFAGIWPESPSFRDDGVGEVPRRWKGRCIAGDRFNASNCNRLACT
jgi:hypothetical protein